MKTFRNGTALRTPTLCQAFGALPCLSRKALTNLRAYQLTACILLASAAPGLSVKAANRQALPEAAPTAGRVQLVATSPHTFRLLADHPAAQSGRVEIRKLSTGQRLYLEKYNAVAYAHNFSFSHLATGRYVIRHKSGRTRYSYTIWVTTHKEETTAVLSKLVQRLGRPAAGPAAVCTM
jgi:hypothetical protein